MSKTDILKEITNIEARQVALKDNIENLFVERTTVEKALQYLILHTSTNPAEFVSVVPTADIPHPALLSSLHEENAHLTTMVSNDSDWLGVQLKLIDATYSRVFAASQRVENVCRLAHINEQVSDALKKEKPEFAAKQIHDAQKSVSREQTVDSSTLHSGDTRAWVLLLGLEGKTSKQQLHVLREKMQVLESRMTPAAPPLPSDPCFAELLAYSSALGRLGDAMHGLQLYSRVLCFHVEAQLYAADAHPCALPATSTSISLEQESGFITSAKFLTDALGRTVKIHSRPIRQLFGKGTELFMLLALEGLCDRLIGALLTHFKRVFNSSSCVDRAMKQVQAARVAPLGIKEAQASPQNFTSNADIETLNIHLEEFTAIVRECQVLVTTLQSVKTTATQALLDACIVDLSQIMKLEFFPSIPAIANTNTITITNMANIPDIFESQKQAFGQPDQLTKTTLLCRTMPSLFLSLSAGAQIFAPPKASLSAVEVQSSFQLYHSSEIVFLQLALLRALGMDTLPGHFLWEVEAGLLGVERTRPEDISTLDIGANLRYKMREQRVGPAVGDCVALLTDSLERCLDCSDGGTVGAVLNKCSEAVLTHIIQYYRAEVDCFSLQYATTAKSASAYSIPAPSVALAKTVLLQHGITEKPDGLKSTFSQFTDKDLLTMYYHVRHSHLVAAANACVLWQRHQKQLVTFVQQRASQNDLLTPQISLITASLSSMDELIKLFQDVAKQAMHVLASTLAPSINDSCQPLQNANFVVESEDADKHETGWAAVVAPTLLKIVDPYRSVLHNTLFTQLATKLIVATIHKIYVVVQSKRFTLLGALRLDEASRKLISILSNGLGEDVGNIRELFVRLVQVVHLLQLSRPEEAIRFVSDADDSYSQTKLTPTQAQKLLLLRVDLPQSSVDSTLAALNTMK